MYGSHKGTDLNNWENSLIVDEKQEQNLQQVFSNKECV